MASYAKHIHFFFLAFLCFSLHIQARESKFFSKVTTNNVVIGSKIPILETPTSAPAPAPTESLSEYGYGLYGRDEDSSEYPTTTPTTTTTTTVTTRNKENEALSEELENQKYDTSFATNNNYNNNNEYHNSNYNNNGYTTDNNNGYNSNNNNNNGYGEEKQGMSDTRFLEKGRYYYDSKNNGENNNGNYNGYEPAGKRGTTRDGVYYGNNNVNSNEFNTMEEYYQSQHAYEYQGNQEGYEP